MVTSKRFIGRWNYLRGPRFVGSQYPLESNSKTFWVLSKGHGPHLPGVELELERRNSQPLP